jgi:ribosome biogenesis protein MAK21
MLIFRVSSSKKEFSNRFYTALYASLHDPRLTNSSKQALYLNLVFRATKADKDPSRVAAFVKRMIQILFGMEVTFVLGALYIVGEVRRLFLFSAALHTNSPSFLFSPHSLVPPFHSQLIATVSGLRELLSVPESERAVVPAKAKETDQQHGPTEFSTAYDGKKREPRFANALNSCLWELVRFFRLFSSPRPLVTKLTVSSFFPPPPDPSHGPLPPHRRPIRLPDPLR